MKYNKKFYERYGLKVTDEPLKKHQEAVTKNVERLYNEVKLAPVVSLKMVAELERLVAEYPTIESFKNYLYLAYSRTKQKDKALDILLKTVELHPDYAFGHISLAGYYVSEEDFDKAASILKEPYDIRNLEKEELIHVSALKSYYSVAIMVELGRKNLEKAEELHRVLFDYDKDDTDIKNLGRQILAARMAKGPLLKKAPNERKVTVISKSIKGSYLSIQSKPVFNHPEIQQLYKYSLKNIPKSIVESILKLPRPTLIQDLEHVLMDAILRYKYFETLDWNDNTHNFAIHALYMLTEHRSYRSLPVILDFLRQDDDFKKYWVADWLETYFHTPLYILGQNQLEVLKAFALEENLSPWHRTLACHVAGQLAMKQPNRRAEVIQWFKDIIQYHFDHSGNNNLIDSLFLSSLISDLIHISAVELEEDIKKLFATGWIEDGFCGDLEEVLKDLHKPIDPFHNDPLPTDIYELYNQGYEKRRDRSQIKPDPELANKLNDPYHNYLVDLMMEGLKENEDDEDDEFDDDYDDWTPQQPVKREEPKVGRNDPCPCGSGKKYKKCHGK